MDATEQAYLRQAARLAGQDKDAAAAIGISPERFSRLINGKSPHHLDVRNCFKLAAYLGETPQAILRAAGKADIADALDEYAPATRRPVARPDPLVAGLAEALEQGADRLLAWAAVNALRQVVGLPAIELPPVRKRAGNQ